MERLQLELTKCGILPQMPMSLMQTMEKAIYANNIDEIWHILNVMIMRGSVMNDDFLQGICYLFDRKILNIVPFAMYFEENDAIMYARYLYLHGLKTQNCCDCGHKLAKLYWIKLQNLQNALFAIDSTLITSLRSCDWILKFKILLSAKQYDSAMTTLLIALNNEYICDSSLIGLLALLLSDTNDGYQYTILSNLKHKNQAVINRLTELMDIGMYDDEQLELNEITIEWPNGYTQNYNLRTV